MKFDVELIGLPARIKVKFAPESMPVFEPNPRFSYDRALAWFDKEINNRIENYMYGQFVQMSLYKEMFMAGLAGLPENYECKPWPGQKYKPDLTPFEEDTLKYQRAYNEALNLQSEWSKEKYNEMFITITNVVNGGVDGVNAAPEESDP